MKRKSLLMACLLSMAVCTYAENDKPVQFNQLPQAAQEFIRTYFPDVKVSFAKMESGLFYKNYDILFTNGAKIEFDDDGKWTEITCQNTGIPKGIIPQRIQQYVAENYPDTEILKIEKDGHDYEVKLSNRLEITFDLDFNVTDLDND